MCMLDKVLWMVHAKWHQREEFHLGYFNFRDESKWTQAEIELPTCTDRVKYREQQSKAAALMEDCGVCRE